MQARPITGLRDVWNDSLTGDYLWTNTNLGEAIPDVMTPLTWSLVQIFMEHAMATASLPDFRGYGMVAGRFYLTISLTAAIAGTVGVSEQRYRSLTEATFGRLPDRLAIPPVPLPRLHILREVVPAAWRTVRSVRPLMKRLPGFVATNPARCASLVHRIGTADAAGLRAIWDVDSNSRRRPTGWRGPGSCATTPSRCRAPVVGSIAGRVPNAPVSGPGPR